MGGFIIPIVGGRVSGEKSRLMTISSFRDSKVLSTYDGIVTQVDPNVCNGFIQIEHDINDVPYFSNFCNVGRIMVGRRLPVSQGETIGYLGDESLEYSIVDDNDDKQSLSNFFKRENRETSKEVDSNKSDDKDKTDKIKSVELPKDNYVDRTQGKDVGFHSLMKNALVAPFHVTDFLEKKRLNNVESRKNKKKEEEKLNEELNRIKQLLK